MYKSLLLIILVSLFALFSCTEEQSPLASVSHNENWADQNSSEFHAYKVRTIGSVTCVSCHGKEIQSGKEDSFCISCHNNYPGATYPHKESWMLFDDPESHGEYVKANGTNLNCNTCHAEDLAIARPCNACH